METFHSHRAPTYASHSMVASSQPLAIQIGLEALKQGGNAVDAAVALLNLLDRGMNLQEAIDAPRVRALGGLRISAEQTFASEFIDRLAPMRHQIIPGEEAPADRIQPHEFARSFKGSAQAVAIDLKLGTLCGASDPRLDEVALGY